MGLETAAIVGLATAAGTAGAGVAGAKISSNANKNAAKLQTDAANRAAEIQAQSQREALAFQQQQAAEDARRFEATQRANYDQWAARQGYQSTVGSMLGLPSRSIPSYVSSLPGRASPGVSSGGSGADPKLRAAIDAYAAKNPANIEGLTSALNAQGFKVKRFDYGKDGGLSNNELDLPGIGKYKVLGAEGTPGAYWYVPGTDDSAPGAAPTRNYVSPLSALLPPRQTYMSRPLTPALRLPGGY
jgi:hypothetical protein